MKKIRKKLILTILSAVLGMGMAAGLMPVQAAEQQVNLPSKYSSVALGYTPKIRDQAPYGNCWAHSAIACMEIAMIKDKLASPETLSLSVPHGIYYFYRPVTDPLGGTEGDYTSVNTDTVTTMLQTGGYASYIGLSALAWQGPVRNEDFFDFSYLQQNYNNYDDAEALNTEAYAYGNRAAIVTEMVKSKKPGINEMKQAIIEYGSVGINYDSNVSYYDSEQAAHYCPTDSAVDHAVTVVGWNDTFPKENFKQRPLEDGAWLVRNSAGESYGNDGYFWLSYEDKSMETVCAFKVAAVDTYDNNYQYNSVGSHMEVINAPAGQKLDAVNIFEIQKEKELLKAVQFSMADTDLAYSVQIYKNPTEDGNPLSGETLLSTPITGEEAWEGVYTVDLEDPVWLEQGDSIAVCVTFTPQISYMYAGAEYEYTKPSLPNRSLYRIEGGNWVDCADESRGNFTIKAFTSDMKDGIAEEHVHNWSQDLSYDGDGHWYECNGSGTCDAGLTSAERGYEEHFGGTATCNSRAVCEGCDQEYGLFSNQHKGDTVCEVCGETISYLDREKTDNPYYELTTITGETVTTQAEGRPKLMIFFGAKCGPCINTMTNLVSEKLKGVDICALDVNQYNIETIEALKNSLADTPGIDDIQFCYNPDISTEVRAAYTNAFIAMNPDAQISSLPIIAYIDADNNLRHMTSGLQEFQQIKQNLTAYCGYEAIGLNTLNPSNAVFPSINEDEITVTAEGKPKILIFYSAEGCRNSAQTILNFSQNLPAGVDFVAIESFGRDKEKVLSFKEVNASGDNRIMFSYGGFWTDMKLMYLESAGIDTSQFVSPIVCYIDEDNNLQYVSTGLCTNAEMRLILERYCGYRETVDPEPTPTPPIETDNPFVDVKEDMFFYAPVLWAVEQQITSGVTPSTFEPFTGCTRGEIVTFLYRAMKGEVSDTVNCSFTDVKEDAFYYNAVLWAVENKITAGVTTTTFAPNNICTRAEIVSFLYRLTNGGIEGTADCPFTDIKENDYYYEAVLWAVEEEITAGLTADTFAPNKECTRGESVSFLYRLLKDAAIV